MRTIKCRCGYEFSLVPDLHMMTEIIERHVVFHQEEYNLTEKEADQIRDDLIFQTLQLALKKS
jgi:hypothetical protein